MATSEELENEAEKNSQKPKPDPFEQDARREIHRYHQETENQKKKRQAQNRKESKDISTVSYPKGRQASLRDKLIASAIGKNVRFDLQRGPAIKARLLEVDLEMGNCILQGPKHSPNSLMFVEFRHIVRLEIFPD